MIWLIIVTIVALSLFAGWELFIRTAHWLNDISEGAEDEDEMNWILYGK